jgi:hypothetical protein
MEDHSDSTKPEDAIEAFIGLFGEIDIYAKIVIEELLEVLIEKK